MCKCASLLKNKGHKTACRKVEFKKYLILFQVANHIEIISDYGRRHFKCIHFWKFKAVWIKSTM